MDELNTHTHAQLLLLLAQECLALPTVFNRGKLLVQDLFLTAVML